MAERESLTAFRPYDPSAPARRGAEEGDVTVTDDEKQAICQRVEDRVDDYLADCRLNYLEPRGERIAEIVREILDDA